MCNRYVSPEVGDMERYWQLRPGQGWRDTEVFPRAMGPFIRGAPDLDQALQEIVIGQWGLIPWFAKTPQLAYSTNNPRFRQRTSRGKLR